MNAEVFISYFLFHTILCVKKYSFDLFLPTQMCKHTSKIASGTEMGDGLQLWVIDDQALTLQSHSLCNQLTSERLSVVFL